MSLGFLLIVAAFLKSTSNRNIIGTTTLLVFIELLLALWLLDGWARTTARTIALAFFAALAAVSLRSAYLGHRSCDCFGSIRVRPWVTFGIDVIAVIALLVTPAPGSQVHRRSVYRDVLCCLVGTCLLPMSTRLTGQNPGAIVPIVVSADSMRGKEFQLLQEIDIAEVLRRGRWKVLLYDPECGLCQEALQSLKEVLSATSEHAFVTIPIDNHAFAEKLGDVNGALEGHLRSDVKLVGTPPIVIELQEGLVLDVKEGRDAVSFLAAVR
jgi:hypothetical protein